MIINYSLTPAFCYIKEWEVQGKRSNKMAYQTIQTSIFFGYFVDTKNTIMISFVLFSSFAYALCRYDAQTKQREYF